MNTPIPDMFVQHFDGYIIHFEVEGKPACRRIRAAKATSHYKRTKKPGGVTCFSCRRTKPYKEATK